MTLGTCNPHSGISTPRAGHSKPRTEHPSCPTELIPQPYYALLVVRRCLLPRSIRQLCIMSPQSRLELAEPLSSRPDEDPVHCSHLVPGFDVPSVCGSAVVCLQQFSVPPIPVFRITLRFYRCLTTARIFNSKNFLSNFRCIELK